MRLYYGRQFGEQTGRFVFEVETFRSPEDDPTGELASLRSDVARIVAPTIPTEYMEPQARFEFLLQNTDKTSLKDIIEALPEKEREPFRRKLIQEMFPDDTVKLTIDDNPFSGPGRNGMEVFFQGLTHWLDELGCSLSEKREYIAQMVELYVCGHTMLRQYVIEEKVIGGDLKREWLAFHDDKITKNQYHDMILEVFDGKDPSKDPSARVKTGFVGDRPDTIKALVQGDVPASVFRFHTVVGDHHDPDAPFHIAQDISYDEFKLRIRAFESMMREAGLGDDYQVTTIRTPGGKGTMMNSEGETVIVSKYLKQNIEDWNDEFPDQKLALRHWNVESDAGRDKTPQEVQKTYLGAVGKKAPFVLLMHFAREDMEQFDQDFYTGLAHGLLNQKYKTQLSLPEGYEIDVNPDKHTVLSGDTWSSIADKYKVDRHVLAQFNKGRTIHDIVRVGEKLVIPYGVQRHVIKKGDRMREISDSLGLEYEAVRRFNGIKPGERFVVGQSLLLPVVEKVERGDRLSMIVARAQDRGIDITVPQLKRYNNLGRFTVGQPLFLCPVPDHDSMKTPLAHKPRKRTKISNDPTKYEVMPGDVLGRISRKTGVLIKDLQRYNRLTDDRINVGQILRLTPPPGMDTETEPTPISERTHLVWKGDHLGDIADMYGVTLHSLRVANDMKVGDRITVGQGLIIPSFHVVEKGERLGNIATLYGITVESLRELNDMKSGARFAVGQRLEVPTKDIDIFEREAQARSDALERIEVGNVDSVRIELGARGIELYSTGKAAENAVETGWLAPGETMHRRTILTGIARHTVDGLLFISHISGYAPHLSGAAEGGNKHLTGVISHPGGRKADLRIRSGAGQGRELKNYIIQNGVHIANSEHGKVYQLTVTGIDVDGVEKTYDYEVIMEPTHMDMAVLTPGDRIYRREYYRKRGELIR